MSWLGNLGNFELFNLKGMANQVKEDPWRLFVGSADPLSTKFWNKLTGSDSKPIIDQWGGAADHRYQEAEDAGIDTRAGRTGHNVAKTIASFYAGGYGADKAGGLLSSGTGGGSATWVDGAGKVVGQAPGSGSGAIGGAQSQPGLLSTFGGKLKSANEAVEPYMQAYQIGQQFMPQGQQAQSAPQPVMAQNMGGGPETLAMLANQGRQAQDTMLQNSAAAREARRANRRGLLG
jgi:hypothetical protein